MGWEIIKLLIFTIISIIILFFIGRKILRWLNSARLPT